MPSPSPRSPSTRLGSASISGCEMGLTLLAAAVSTSVGLRLHGRLASRAGREGVLPHGRVGRGHHIATGAGLGRGLRAPRPAASSPTPTCWPRPSGKWATRNLTSRAPPTALRPASASGGRGRRGRRRGRGGTALGALDYGSSLQGGHSLPSGSRPVRPATWLTGLASHRQRIPLLPLGSGDSGVPRS